MGRRGGRGWRRYGQKSEGRYSGLPILDLLRLRLTFAYVPFIVPAGMYNRLPLNKRKFYDLHDEIYEIVSRLVVRAEDEPAVGGQSRLAMKSYVQWSKNGLQPLDEAIEALARSVRDSTKAGEKIYTRAERAELEAQYQELRKQHVAHGQGEASSLV